MTALVAVGVPAPVVVVAALSAIAVVVALGVALRRRSAASTSCPTSWPGPGARPTSSARGPTRPPTAWATPSTPSPRRVLITDAAGQVVFRNQIAETFESARHSDALVEAAITELVGAALGGQAGRRTIELFGPPRRTLVIATTPLVDDAPGEPAGPWAARWPSSTTSPSAAASRPPAATSWPTSATSCAPRSGRSGLLAETLVAEDDPAVATRLAERIVTEAFRLARTIEDLLVLSTHRDRGGTGPRAGAGAPGAGRGRRAHPPGRRAGRHRHRGGRARPPHGRVRRPAPGHLGPLQPARQRGEVLRRRVGGRGVGRHRRHRRGHRGRATTASASPRPTSSGSSSASTGSTRPAAARPAGPAWGWPSSATWPPTTTATCGSSSRLGEGSTFELVLPSARVRWPWPAWPTTTDPAPTVRPPR